MSNSPRITTPNVFLLQRGLVKIYFDFNNLAPGTFALEDGIPPQLIKPKRFIVIFLKVEPCGQFCRGGQL